MLAQQSKDTANRAEPDIVVRKARDDFRLGKVLEGDDENTRVAADGGSRHLAGQRTATGQYAQRATWLRRIVTERHLMSRSILRSHKRDHTIVHKAGLCRPYGTNGMKHSTSGNQASATGILLCLRKLADEAATLQLLQTASLILGAAEAAAQEASHFLPSRSLAHLN